MSYKELIKQEGEYTYSANIQFDIENDTKLSRFIPNETTINLLKEYFVDMTREEPFNHSRILYGSYGTGKSHFLTVLGQILGKSQVDGVAFDTFINRIAEIDEALASDIIKYVNDKSKKPLLVVPVVFDFPDFDRCIYFSLKKKLDELNIKINYKTFYDQANILLNQWLKNDESNIRLNEICLNNKINLDKLLREIGQLKPNTEKVFNKIFSEMTYGVNFVYEASNMSDTLNQVNSEINDSYSGILFIFDEFGRYIEDNIKKIKVKSVQDFAEYCDHCKGNNHILLVSHKEISQYSRYFGKSVSNEWKKVEGRYKADSIINKQDQCLSLVKSVLIKNEPIWTQYKKKYSDELDKIYSDAFNFKGFLIDRNNKTNPFEGGFPLHPISLFALDRLSKKVAQNDRTFFTYLASKEKDSLYHFLVSHDLDEFHFVGIDNIFDYFEPNIKAVQSDDSFGWYKKLQTALAKNHSDLYDTDPETKILKVIATIGIINDANALQANKENIFKTIDCEDETLERALTALCEKKIIKYSGLYNRYDFFDASIYDVDSMIDEESTKVTDQSVVKILNDNFVKFKIMPYEYNRDYKISRTFVPYFTTLDTLSEKNIISRFGNYYDGIVIMIIGDSNVDIDIISKLSNNYKRCIFWVNNNCSDLFKFVRKYISANYIDTQKSRYISKDPTFEQELQYNIIELSNIIDKFIDNWRNFEYENGFVLYKDNQIFLNNITELSKVCSEIMYESFPDTLIVNNELLNKNSISPSIATAKKNAIKEMISGKKSDSYFDLPILSPDYISVRSVLYKNGFENDADLMQNTLSNGNKPQLKIKSVFDDFINRAKKSSVEFSEIYETLKKSPYGLRDGYMSLVITSVLIPYLKSLVIASHGTEQELTAELMEEIVKRPYDFNFTIANWSMEQIEYISRIEDVYGQYINKSLLAKNRLKAAYEAMLSHYKSISKFARTTDNYVSDQTKTYRKLMEKNNDSYTEFFFEKIRNLTGDYFASSDLVALCKNELENAEEFLYKDLKLIFCDVFNLDDSLSLAEGINSLYESEWKAKRKKSFDYYTNTFLEFAETIHEQEDSCVIKKLAKLLTGIETSYWNDNLKDEYEGRLKDIREILSKYSDDSILHDGETQVTLTSANGKEKCIVFDNKELTPLAETAKNKISATFANFGLAISYDEKVQIILSLLGDLMEGI